MERPHFYDNGGNSDCVTRLKVPQQGGSRVQIVLSKVSDNSEMYIKDSLLQLLNMAQLCFHNLTQFYYATQIGIKIYIWFNNIKLHRLNCKQRQSYFEFITVSETYPVIITSDSFSSDCSHSRSARYSSPAIPHLATSCPQCVSIPSTSPDKPPVPTPASHESSAPVYVLPSHHSLIGLVVCAAFLLRNFQTCFLDDFRHLMDD